MEADYQKFIAFISDPQNGTALGEAEKELYKLFDAESNAAIRSELLRFWSGYIAVWSSMTLLSLASLEAIYRRASGLSAVIDPRDIEAVISTIRESQPGTTIQ